MTETDQVPDPREFAPRHCKDHGNGRVCVHKSGGNVEITYTRTKNNNDEVWARCFPRAPPWLTR